MSGEGQGQFRLEDLLRPFQAQDLAGKTLSGCVVERLLGRGGMGSVWLARGPDGAQVVVKVLDPALARDEALRARFRREWEALRKVHPHPNVVRILHVGGEEHDPNIVMEFVEGATLHALVQRGRFAPARAAAAIRDAALGLAAVHRHGLVHRDVKPGNLMVTTTGVTKVVDFGLAKDMFQTSLTQPGQLLGTAAYMAPEQWADAKVHDPRVDVFALGATLYHLLAGRPPFEGEDVHEIADRIQSGDYPPLRDAAPDVPRELELVVHLMLMPEPRYRYARMEDVADDLTRATSGQPARAPALVDPRGRRYALVPGRRLTLGRDPACGVVIDDEAVSPKHAQVRRDAAGFALHDLRGSAGTAVNGAPVARAVVLKDGDRVRLGALELVFEEPLARAETPAFLACARRDPAPDPLVRLLAERGDPRAALALLEDLAPDPAAELEAGRAVDVVLGLGPEVARAVVAWRRAQAPHAAARARALLARLAPGHQDPQEPQDPVGAWLAWWAQARASAPAQLVAARPPRVARLRVLTGEATPASLTLPDAGVALVGRDARCQLQLRAQTASRLQATVLRLHRRVAVRDEGGRASTWVGGASVRAGFVDPGVGLQLAEVRLALEVELAPDERLAPQVAPGLFAVDPLTALALEELRHPAAASSLVGAVVEGERLEWVDPAAAALFPGDPARAAELALALRGALVGRAQRARALLVALFGQDAGPGAAWAQALAARRATLPAQAVPAGWVAAARAPWA
jgi:predicted Ser/Thr protein kinase